MTPWQEWILCLKFHDNERAKAMKIIRTVYRNNSKNQQHIYAPAAGWSHQVFCGRQKPRWLPWVHLQHEPNLWGTERMWALYRLCPTVSLKCQIHRYSLSSDRIWICSAAATTLKLKAARRLIDAAQTRIMYTWDTGNLDDKNHHSFLNEAKIHRRIWKINECERTHQSYLPYRSGVYWSDHVIANRGWWINRYRMLISGSDI